LSKDLKALTRILYISSLSRGGASVVGIGGICTHRILDFTLMGKRKMGELIELMLATPLNLSA